MPSFEIPDGPATVPIKAAMVEGKPTRTGSVTYNVTNKSTQGLSGRISVLVAGDAKAEWFKVEGEKERQFGPGETQTVTVAIDVPTAVKAGAYKFRPRVVAVNDPDNDHTDGPVATMQVPPVPRGTTTTTGGGKPFPMWAIAAIIGGVLVIGAIIAAVVFWPDGEDPNAMPDIVAMKVDEASARKSLEGLATKLKLNISTEPTVQAGASEGLVVGQDPAPETELTEGQKVVLKVAAAQTFPAPAVLNVDYREAIGQLKAQGFQVEAVAGQKPGSPPDHVFAQEPAAGTRIAKSTPIKLTYDPGVKVPDLRSGEMSVSRAVQRTGGEFVINAPTIQCQERARPGEDIIDQDLPAGATVARMSTITVKVVGYQERCLQIFFPYAKWKSILEVNPSLFEKK